MVWLPRRRREEGGEEEQETLPPPHERTSVLAVDPATVKTNIIQEFFTSPVIERPREELYLEELEKIVAEKAEQIYLSLIASQTQLSQQIMNVVNRRAMESSLALMINNVFEDAAMKIYAIRSSIHEIARQLRDPSVKPERKRTLLELLVDKCLTLLAVPRAVSKILKDLDSRININLPFHLKSDLARNLMGYTST